MFKPKAQFSVFLVNKPGILSQVCDALADNKINIVALTLMDSVEHGVFRFVTTDAERTRGVLKALNIPMTETEVLSVEMPNRPGIMAELCARLNSQHISIRYAYVTSGAVGGRTMGIFKVDNMQKAMKISSDRNPNRRERKIMRVAPNFAIR